MSWATPAGERRRSGITRTARSSTRSTPAIENGHNGAHCRSKRTFLRSASRTAHKEWLVKGLLGHGEASAFYGKPGDGKSALVEDLVFARCGGLAMAWQAGPAGRRLSTSHLSERSSSKRRHRLPRAA